jgi:hypothetical protein
LLRKEQSSYPTLSTDSLMLGFCCNKPFDCAGMARVRSFHPKASDLAADLAGLKFQPHGYGVHISRLKLYIFVVVTMHVSCVGPAFCKGEARKERRLKCVYSQQQLLNRVFDDGGTSGGRASMGDEHVQGVAFQTSHTRNYRSYTIPE